MNIPVANAFRLLAYAWDVAPDADRCLADSEGLEAPIDLLAHTLAVAMGDVLRRGVRREYVETDMVVAGIRGRLLLARTLQQNLLASARTECRISELTEDTRANRLVRATIHALLRVPGLDRRVGNHLHDIDARLSTIPVVRIRRSDFRQVQIHRNNRLYRLVLSICLLIHDRLLPVDHQGTTSFRDFRRDRRFMWRVFERFVARFYAREQGAYRVSSPKVAWHAFESFGSDRRRIPEMRTDIVLRTGNRTLVVDTKFYSKPLGANRFGAPKLRSGNLYQLLTYMYQLRNRELSPQRIDGMLLYPAVESNFDLRYAIDGMGVRAATVDLSRDWPDIKENLLGLLEPWRPWEDRERSAEELTEYRLMTTQQTGG